jgi:D-sedoheptulose 7-phosphate isomerase
VHPVIVGKRALPAIGLAGEGGDLAEQVALVVEADDIAIGFGAEDGGVAPAVDIARERGALTLAFTHAGAEWEFEPPGPDALVRQELVETLYHVLWELVHVFFDHRGLLEGRSARRTHDTGASSFLYPFLAETEHDLEAVVEDVRSSVLAKAGDVGELRTQTLTDNRAELIAAAAGLREDLEAGGRLLALGNGGSATDAMDVVADFRHPADPRWRSRRALDLTEDAAILTAIANDIGVEAIFSRQVIAHGRTGDALLAISTSGNSANVIAALGEARARGLRTIAMVGYDGGRVAAEELADQVIVTSSEHIPRIQEAQASAYHVLRELVA